MKFQNISQSKLICGIDEAGRGPVIGPMIIAIACIDNMDKLIEIGVKDSKELTHEKRLKLLNKIKQVIKYFNYVIIQPNEIDEYVNKHMLNELEVKYFVQLIFNVYEKFKDLIEIVYVDSPDIKPDRLRDRIVKKLLKLGINVKICALHDADKKIPIVSAASIIAKCIRENEIKKLKRIYGDFGSGYPSDRKTIEYLINVVKNCNFKTIPPIIRKSWGTFRKLVQIYCSEKIDNYFT